MIKKILNSLFILLISLNLNSQNVRITTILNGDVITPKVIELYVEGTVDVTHLKLQFQTESAVDWKNNNAIGKGEYTDSFLYIVNDSIAFDDLFKGIRTSSNTTIATFASNVKEHEKIRLVDTSNNNQVLDIYDSDEMNDENTHLDFSNFYVKRKNSFGPKPQFDITEWNVIAIKTLFDNDKNDKLKTYKSSHQEIGAITKNNLTIFPNPSKDFVEIFGIQNPERYIVYNKYGEKVLNGFIAKNERIKVNSLSKGSYRIKTEKGEILKFIKN